MPLCIGLASLSKCFWARGAATCGRDPARPCLSCCLLYCIGLTLKSRRFDVRSGRGSESVWQGVWEDVPEGREEIWKAWEEIQEGPGRVWEGV